MEKIKSILNNHNMQYETIEKSPVGFINEVYLTERYAVKLYGERNKNGFQKELWFYKNAKPFYAPDLIAYGEDYIILERVYGTGLFRLWRDMNNSEREKTVEKIADIIGHINSVDYHTAEDIFSVTKNFKENVIGELESHLSELKKTSGIPDELAEEVKEYVKSNANFIDDKELYLTYADLHFDNLLVTNDGKLYLIDYEMLKAAPKDYVLDVWQRMLIHPFTYANEEDHELTHAKDYTCIISWLKKYAPDLFSHNRVKERVNIYCMLYELNILRSYPMGEWPIERLEKYLCGVDW